MNQHDRQEVQELRDQLEALEKRLAKTPARRSSTPPRWAGWLAAIGLVALPAIGWTAVELEEFEPQTPISAASVNGNFAALAAAVAVREKFVAGPLVASHECLTDTPCISDDLSVSIETDGSRAVRVELIAAGGTSQNTNIFVGNDAGGQTDIQAEFQIQRRTEGGDWATVYQTLLRYVEHSTEAGLVAFPPSMVSFVDREAPVGTHTYRLVTRVPIPGPVTFSLNQVRLAASDAGAL